MTNTTTVRLAELVCHRAMTTRDCPLGHAYDAQGIPSHRSWEAHQDALTMERARQRQLQAGR